MSIKPLEFSIRPKFDSEPAIASMKKLVHEMREEAKMIKELEKKYKLSAREAAAVYAAQRKEIEKTHALEQAALKKTKEAYDDFYKRHETGFDRLRRSMGAWSRDLSMAFDIGPIRGINKLQSGFEGVLGKLFNLKNAILGSAVGYGAYKLIGGTLHAGQEQMAVEGRVRRLVGEKNLTGFMHRADKLGLAAGIQGDDAARGLIPLFEAIQDSTEKGTYGGRKLAPKDLEKLRSNLLDKGSSIFRRLSALHPDMPSEDLGRLVAQAGTGPEGIPQLLRALGLRKLGRDEKAKYKNAKIGDMLEGVLGSRGEGEDAFLAKQKTFSFQVSSIGSQLKDALGNVGKQAIESLNKALGQGTTLAEKLQKYLASPDGEKMIKKLSDALAGAVKWVAELATKIPQAFSWISEHKTLLTTLIGGYGALRVGGGIMGAFGKLPNVGGPTPVFVTGAAPGVMGGGPSLPGGSGGVGIATVAGAAAIPAAMLGYLAVHHQARDVIAKGMKTESEKLQLDLIYGRKTAQRKWWGGTSYRDITDPTEQMQTMQKFRAQLKGVGGSKLLSQVEALENVSSAPTPEQTMFMAAQGGSGQGAGVLQVNSVLMMDGEKMGTAVTKHQIKRARRETGNE